ncbi:beta-glucosidase family protein [Tomitella fengzijianii]|nr:glycoside hydrolase family 3 protein [Tomitella fengzijianii]
MQPVTEGRGRPTSPMKRPVADVAGEHAGPGCERDLLERLARLDLRARVRLLTGADFWSLRAEPAIGLRPIVFSDGPAGIRGGTGAAHRPSLSLPSGSALGATWDVEAARRYGDLLGREARERGVDVVLGPTINMHRSPYGGRHFEAMSEDPLLTGRLAAAYVDGVQAHGVAACPKHFVGNDYEVERHTASSEIDARALREVYLAAFEPCVAEAGAWAVMSAYNGVNGVRMSEHPLLSDPLKSEWGFDGAVVSDWIAVRSTDDSARAAQDLVMPSLMSPWEDSLVEAVEQGRVPSARIDEKVLRILRLAARVGALDPVAPPAAVPVPVAGEDAAAELEDAAAELEDAAAELEDAAAELEDAAAELAADGMVLLRNDAELPWARAPRSIAVIGPHGLAPRTQGGGSVAVSPRRVVSPLDGIRQRFPESEVTFRMGVTPPDTVFPFTRAQLRDPQTGGEGLRAVFTADDGRVLVEELHGSSELTWLGTLPDGAARLVLRTEFTPAETGRAVLGVACAGPVRLAVDGSTVIDADGAGAGLDPDELARMIFAPPVRTVEVDLVAGRSIVLEVHCDLARAPLPLVHSVMFGWAPHGGTAEELLAEAVAAAESAEVAVVVAGTGARSESEGFDRSTLAMQGGQDALIAAIAQANPRTVVVVNAGSPVAMPWRETVPAILLGWFGGQEVGTALAGVLAGDREPGGRLPTTWPADDGHVLLGPDRPVDGKVHYDESIHVGHRGWLRAGRTPAYCFGHGLGYTEWEFQAAGHPATVRVGETLRLRIGLRNVGTRTGKQVIQVYAERRSSVIDHPVRWLAGFCSARFGPGEHGTADVDIHPRQFSAWTDRGWWQEPGEFRLLIGTSVQEIALSSSVEVIE